MTTMTAERLDVSFRAMATTVTMSVLHPSPAAEAAMAAARRVFERVEAACTRFDANSPLMQANAEPMRWHDVPHELASAVMEASRAHVVTHGVFDPRVLEDLVRLGYDHSWPQDEPGPGLASAHDVGPCRTRSSYRGPVPAVPTVWRPRWEDDGLQARVHLGGQPIDLGGIGKGLAVRWAAGQLRDVGEASMVAAGGDCQFAGPTPSGQGWRVGVEDPRGGVDPLAVLEISDGACATSSTRVRRWNVDGRQVHHLIDPRTGDSGGEGLLSVTVLHADVAWAEVWSKTLFLAGASQVKASADEHGLAAAWVEAQGDLHVNAAASAQVIWSAV